MAAEYGSDVAISAVNRIRSGGVAGFFCREEFEVIVDLRSPSPRRGQGLGRRPAQRRSAGQPPTTGSGRRASSPYRSGPPRTGKLEDPATFLSQAFGDNDDYTADDYSNDDYSDDDYSNNDYPADDYIDEPIDDEFDPDTTDGYAGPAQHDDVDNFEPEGGDFGPEGGDFEPEGPAVEARHEVSPGGADLFDPVPDEGWPSHLEHQPDPEPAISTEPAESEPQPEPTEPADQPPMPQSMPQSVSEPMPELPVAEPAIPAFWSRVIAARDELSSFLPDDASSMVCVGPLALVMPVVGRLRSTAPLASSEVVVLTDRTEIVSEPEWTLVRSGNQLIEQAKLLDGRPAIMVIDVPVDLPNWVGPLVNRLQMSGVGLVRYAVPEPTLDQLEGYRSAGDGSYVIDVISRAPAELLAAALDRRHPIASVAGAAMSAELMVAVREQVGVER